MNTDLAVDILRAFIEHHGRSKPCVVTSTSGHFCAACEREMNEARDALDALDHLKHRAVGVNHERSE